MTHKFDTTPVLPVEWRLEGQDDGDAAGQPGQALGAPRLPRPDLWSDVVEYRNAEPHRVPRDPHVEARIVDRNHHIGRLLPQETHYPPLKPPEEAQPPENFHKAHHGEFVEVAQELHPGHGHALAAQAHHLHTGPPAADLAGDARTVRIAGGLARQNHDPAKAGLAVGRRLWHQWSYRVRRSARGTR